MYLPGHRKTEAPIRTCWIFEDWSYRYIQKLISDQIRGVVKNLGADVEHSMAATYAGYTLITMQDGKLTSSIKSTKGYRFWEKHAGQLSDPGAGRHDC